MTIASVVVRQRVEDLDVAVQEAVAAGTGASAPPPPTPNGRRAVLRHPYGGVFEHVGP
ncbi:hypothetical protein [Streptomyces sp. CC208A]|uniref:hypothetical protein n=1 Tax=Streptomyces sp. CC208A TaxID=3044573 RepID=UPI0024A9661C|nr:hypothetical protein [Streptomyces sp. CC208A]